MDDKLHVKIGDFGLATEITKENERKKTLCGTPNYIAPEILTKKGHGFEVDIWSTGCIMYTLLVGKPPFETNSLKETYSRIKKNEYIIPEDRVGHAAAELIIQILQSNPERRPKVNDILKHDFIKIGTLSTHVPSYGLKGKMSQIKTIIFVIRIYPEASTCVCVNDATKTYGRADELLDYPTATKYEG